MVTNKFNLSTENTLTNDFNDSINTFWDKHAQPRYFRGCADKKIYTISISTGNDKAIVISQGRTESVLKYKEVVFDLNRQGYDIYLIDHRGQGFSDRLISDPHRGHVVHFEDYVSDFDTYVSSLNLSIHYKNAYLLSHSMGGAICALYLEKYSSPFDASIFMSPMFSINFNIPDPLASLIINSYAKICTLLNDQPCYVLGGEDYQERLFKNNHYTSSEPRFNASNNLFKDHPKAQLGSPTMHWLKESSEAMKEAIAQAKDIKIPILVIQAGADKVVTSNGQLNFFENASLGKHKNKLLKIPDAQHEILLEQDTYRVPALSAILQFIKS